MVAISVGGLWRTDDAGEAWRPCTSGMQADYVPPELSRWPEVQDPHHVVRCPGAPDALWCQHHGGLYRSTDDADTWREVRARPSSFGFAIAVHPRDPDVAWIVPAESDQRRTTVRGAVVVSRTRDGGASWDVLTDGLPQAHAYDLVLRHALDVAPDGQCLAFGSTTGHVWTTQDQGDRWHALPASLPPVYAVRYAGGESRGGRPPRGPLSGTSFGRSASARRGKPACAQGAPESLAAGRVDPGLGLYVSLPHS